MVVVRGRTEYGVLPSDVENIEMEGGKCDGCDTVGRHEGGSRCRLLVSKVEVDVVVSAEPQKS
eukprot:6476899-Amphidinium_carterae.1